MIIKKKSLSPEDWLQKYFGAEYFTGEFNHLKEIISSLKLDQSFQKIITIAGTNGKGETSRILAQELVKAGKSSALWTSPHLFSVCERFCYNDQFVESEDLIQSFEKTQIFLKKFTKKVSYFEFLFINFLSVAQIKKVDYLVLEVGLGGRLDAVNVLNADLALLTSISRDHQAILGETYKKIIHEKLGITRKDAILISCLETAYLRQISKKHTMKIGCGFKDLFGGEIVKPTDNFSKRNMALAFAAKSYLLEGEIKVDRSQLESVSLFAKRLERKVSQQLFDFYSSHNVDGVRKLVQLLDKAKYNNYDNIIIAFSERSKADLIVMAKTLSRYFGTKNIYLYEFSHPKSVNRKILELIRDEFKLEIIDKQNIQSKIDFSKSQKCLCTGSQYFFSDICHTFSELFPGE